MSLPCHVGFDHLIEYKLTCAKPKDKRIKNVFLLIVTTKTLASDFSFRVHRQYPYIILLDQDPNLP